MAVIQNGKPEEVDGNVPGNRSDGGAGKQESV